MVTFQRSSQQDGPAPTQRSQAKETRRKALLTAAAGLFAADGFNRVSLEDLGPRQESADLRCTGTSQENKPCSPSCC
ncbi:hypothetical protein AHiyo8_14460 [Arthrobacter sp. Hiyo8]|nr:hypothetical protein AHiyo8_14460 [Arthrobacter sp. Hiyo8]